MRVAIPLIVQFGNLFLSKFNPNHADNSPDRLELDCLIIPFLEENILKVQFLAQVSIAQQLVKDPYNFDVRHGTWTTFLTQSGGYVEGGT